MDFPIRRKGKPNKQGGKGRGSGRGGRRGGTSGRGASRGGRFRNEPGGGGGIGGGGGGGRKSSGKAWDDGDDICFSRKPERPAGFSRGHRPGPRGRGGSTHTTPLQTLHMTTENQERVKALLRDLQEPELDAVADDGGSDFEEDYEYSSSEDEEDDDNNGECCEADSGFDFWSSPQEAMDVAGKLSPEAPVKMLPEAVISPFAVGKLSRYGFDRERCMTALRTHDGDVGSSLEYLLQQCFSEAFGIQTKVPRTAENISMNDILAMRQEEAFVLRSICGEKFIERIPSRVWTVGLELGYLTERLQKPRNKDRAKDLGNPTPNNICRFFLKGENCRFGSKCRFRHESPHRNVKDESHLSANDSSYLYELEIRFTKDNKYPYQAPLIAFHSLNENLPMGCRLHMAEYLYEKALTIAQTGEPVVYSLVSCLEDEDDILQLLANTHHRYSIPPPFIRPTSETKQPPIIVNKAMTSEKPTRALEGKKEVNIVKEEMNKLTQTEDEELDDLESEAVVVENESYVNLKKKQAKKYSNTKALIIENAKIRKHFKAKQASRSYQSMLQERMKLPAWQEEDAILKSLAKHQVLVVCGMTGCGKTTQIPQFILDASLQGPASLVSNIVCTQPRRISAISVAERVAQERAERVGISVGYQIRLESVKSSATRLLYCTTGVLLRRLEGDSTLQGVTHVIVDEVHERTEESDFLLLVLKDVMIQRPDLKILLMSATVNAELFSQYFSGCPVIHIPGRTYPVDQFFLEDAISKTRYVLEDGSPYHRSSKYSYVQDSSKGKKGKSYGDLLEELEQDITSSLKLQDARMVKDSMPDQQLSFKELSVRYSGVSKSVIKTLSAMDLDKINLDLIEALLEWIVGGGHSYPPEVFSECRLETVLSKLIEPPGVESLHASRLRLQNLGALTQQEKLTPLGYHLASLPVDVRIGKFMLFGAIFRCLDPALTIAASLASKSPFVCPWDKKEEANKKKLEFAVANSDHLALLQAYKEMASLKRQFTELLSDIGFVKEGLRARDIERRWAQKGDGVVESTGEEANTNAENIKLISAMLCAALYPNVVQVKLPEGKYQVTRAGAVKMQPKAEELKFVTKNDGYIHIHPSSINHQVRHFDSPYLVYHEKIKTSRVFVRDCSMVSVYPLALFGGGQVNVELFKGEFLISLDDGWIRFAAASHQVAELVKELRSELDQLLQDKIKNPTMDLCTCPRGSRIIAMIVKLVTTQ
ncbi:hypothetical protein GDO78_009855 [Eleutherodactylus coqui]|uniref:RNA helicase n=1 Tax=Eleutherodactylus coqui TaxID=57060 RepID=A0A8J6FAQ9_ELECQ|nr:hypothetical protein GDO78_009855 [Eleutherodactylus coqui]